MRISVMAQEASPKTADELRKNGSGELVVSLIAFSGTAVLVAYMASGKPDLDSIGVLFGGGVILATLGTVTMISANKNFRAARALEAQVGMVPINFHSSRAGVPGLGIKFRF
ncbi:hypothetical protein [Algoriphagus mannitolivorans]|uniref:hypothetical protein n=1 Tax=Algoriphagus mannitolivorans TaxID=226504 RepID=UPI0012F96FB1|nr:hypothetical protein [Algoriphagus mannitolivorans]